jgi:acetoin utilization protein AcuB
MRRLRITVEDYTTPSPVTAPVTAPLAELVGIMEKHGIRHVPIVEADRPVGIVSDRDTRLVQRLPGAEGLTAGEIMVREPYTVEPQEALEDVALAMGRQRIGSAIVTEGGRVTGIFTLTDALNALIEVIRGEIS